VIPAERRIEAQGLRKSFAGTAGAVPVLDGVDVHVGRHEFVSVLGPSGCGKSTLFNIVAGLDEPTEGVVSVDGHTAQRIGRCGYMPQKDLLMPWKTIAENVAIGRVVRGQSKPQAKREAIAILERFGLGSFVDHYPSQLSGGMRQRAALARTFLAGNDVLLLDEPFGALDSLTRLQMQSWLLHIWQQSAASVLFITHDVDEALRLSDRVYVFTERPARVAVTIDVDLARPRPYATVLTEAFARLKERAIAHLHTDDEVVHEEGDR
jgi:ABC-type nitrate/sulfonate/bicarbonate transport system ATPase subunit